MHLSRKAIIIIAAIIALSYPAYYLISPLFITTTGSEPLPTTSLTTISQGTFTGSGGHSARGTATVYQTETGGYIVRFEDFAMTNGPDLNVYLAKTANPSQGYVDLGNLKFSSGPQNYDIPSNINLEEYQYVMVWCVSFSVLFGSAQLQA